MRLESLAFCTVSAAALVLGANPATAQTADPATPPDPNVQAQTTPAPVEGAPQTDDAVQTATGQDQAASEEDGQTVVVTGLRRSLQSAQNIKRNSDQIVDAIVAEDIGKLPDVTASAALARVTGVQVNRAAAEAAQVQIRGLPDLSTTYNGREIFTAENRFVAIQDFPAGGVAALEVFKSGTANLIEGGLGGQVNVRSRRPFDFRDLELSGSANAVYFEQSENWDWNGNVLFSNRWDVGDGGEFGILVNAALTNIDFLDSTRENDRFVSPRPAVGDRPAFIAPNGSGLFYGSGDRKRPSLNAAIQYKPNADLQFYVDGLFQGYRGNDSNYFLFVPLFDNSTLTDVSFDKDGLPYRARVSSPNAPDGFQEFRKARTNTYQVGGGVIYDMTSALRLSADLAYTDSTYKEHQVNIDYAFTGSPDRIVYFDHQNGPGGGSFDFIDFDTTDPDNYVYRGLFQNRIKASGDDVQARVDLEWDTGWTNVPKLQFGLRHNNRDAERKTGGLYRGIAPENRPPLSSIGVDVGRFGCGFAYDKYQKEKCFVGASFDDVFDNLDALRDAAAAATGGDPLGDVGFDPLATFTANEKTYTGYAQLRYAFDVGVPIEGNIGLRVVKTKDKLEGNQLDTTPEPDVLTSIDRTTSFTDYLPNISVRAELRRDLQARLAYTETRTRPNFLDLSPSTTFFPPSGACTTEGTDSENCFRDANGGNPDLQSINSKNYDFTLEYYFARQGSLTLALFRRDIRGFIFRSRQDIGPGEDDIAVRLDAPFNSGRGKIRGAEAAFTTFFDYNWLPGWARGFGMQANYTYIDASTELAPNFRAQLPGQQDFPGVSKHAFNLVGLYERNNVSARLAYNWRSKFVVEYNDFQGFQAPTVQQSLGQLDFSASYTPFEKLTIAFDALNLLAGSQPIRTYRAFAGGGGDTFPWGRKYLERVYSIGVRVRY
ncbi:MAG TPA: TonB-dependent receptor [Sphingomicrobium sp.]|nr:TonB-dependent receptor [Sphingomicrobium sp.]